MTKKGFIFDLDGVIVDTAKYHYRAWKKLADQLGFKFTHKHNELLKGVSRKRSLDILLAIGKISASNEQKEYWMDAKNNEYLKSIRKMTAEEILPDVPKVLDFLNTKKQGIALGSASKNATEILTRVGLLNEFEVLIDGNQVTKAKPDPEVFLKGAEKMGLKPENCIVFEDAEAGIKAAKAAGMTAIGIGTSDNLPGADFVFKDFTKISTDFIEQL